MLFDTPAYAHGLRDAVKDFGVTPEIWGRAYRRRDETGAFRLTSQAEHLASLTNRPMASLLEALEKETDDALWYLYADSKAFLEQFSPLANLFLITFGDESLQLQKINATGIGQYFADIVIVDRPKAESDRLPIHSVQQAIFLNDNLDEMLDLARIYRWSSHIQIARSNVPVKKTDGRIPVYENLRDAAGTVAKLLNVELASVNADTIADQSGDSPQQEKLRGAFGQ